MTFVFSDVAGALKAGGSITADDVLAARRSIWADGAVSLPEAEAIFELNRLCTGPAPEWVDFLVEALTEFIVNQQAPRGYVDDANAHWLMEQIDRDGRVETMAELALLVKVVETALSVPAAFRSYVLRQIETVVLTGEGPTRSGGLLRPGVVDEAEVALLRRLVFAPGGDGSIGVGAEEAEMLWRIKDATLGADNAPGWRTLFVQALGNHLMAANDRAPIARDEAQRLETFMDDTESSVGGFLRRLSISNFGGSVRATFARTGADRPRGAEDGIDAAENGWLRQRIDADATIDPLEKALLAFIAEAD